MFVVTNGIRAVAAASAAAALAAAALLLVDMMTADEAARGKPAKSDGNAAPRPVTLR